MLYSLAVGRSFTCLALFGTSLLASVNGSAQTAALLAVADATQLSELRLAKVMADDSSLWLSVRLQGPTRLALVVEEASVESAPAAHAWLAALDFATRVRVAAPPGPLSSCGSSKQLALADSGLPEPRRIPAFETSRAGSELELRRLLADAGLPVEIDRLAKFTSAARAPFQVVIYDVTGAGGSTQALRLAEHGHAGELPAIVLSSARTVPLSLIALAKEGVLPLLQESADPSEFPVAYRAFDSSSDYLAARAGWLAQNPTRWLNEVQVSAALFSETVLLASAPIAPVVSRYFEALSGTKMASCETQILAAHASASLNVADFVCDGADDLARSVSELGSADLRLSRFFGSVSADDRTFRVAPSAPRSPLVHATDFDLSGCPPEMSLPSNPPNDTPDFRSPPPVSTAPTVVRGPDDPYYGAPPVSRGEGSGTVIVFDSGSNDSCSGDSSSGESSGDSCSGDSSSEDDSGPDSCSGDSSDSSSDGCSGDSDSGSDSSGCGKSEYDGDTCSGNASVEARPRPRQVRLSLLTLLAAALALPLRRLRSSR